MSPVRFLNSPKPRNFPGVFCLAIKLLGRVQSTSYIVLSGRAVTVYLDSFPEA